MRVAWVPVLRDPTLPVGATNPIIGRYGFWIDDENARVNINTAYGKATANAAAPAPQVIPGVVSVNGSNYPVGHPTSVNLDTLDADFDRGGFASSILRKEPALGDVASSAQALRFFSSPAVFDLNRFNVTTSSIAPEYNVFGKSRFFFGRYVAKTVTSQLNQYPFDWQGPNYFPRDENNTTTPGAGDTFALYRTASVISDYLSRADWPGMPARSFVDKWGGGVLGQREADQVAWNIVALGGYGDIATPSATNTENNVYTDYQNLLTTGPGSTGSTRLPNSAIPVGRLSQKAIMPALPKPGIQEIALVVTPLAASGAAGRVNVQLGLRCEFRNGDRFPTSNRTASSGSLGFFLTYFSYTVADTAAGSPDTATQTENTYFLGSGSGQSPFYTGVSALYGFVAAGAATPFNPGTFFVVPTNTNRFVFAKNGAPPLNRTQTGAQTFSSTATVRIQAKLRMTAKYAGQRMPFQVIPIWDTHDPSSAALQPPSSSEKDTIDFDFTTDLSLGEVIRSVEVAVPQFAGRSASWVPVILAPGDSDADTLGTINNATAAAGDLSKLNAFSDLNVGAYAASRKPSIGMLSLVPVGMQRGITDTLTFQPSGSAAELPDWLLLDLLAPSVGSPLSINNSTRGRINANGAIFPIATDNFKPPLRDKPLRAVFENMTASPATIATNIVNHKNAAGGVDFGIPGALDYVGEICEVEGVADNGTTAWEKEFLVRNLSGLITTRSNAFRVIGVAQTLRKNPSSTNYGVYEVGDAVTGETRFEAVVERYMWQGKDGHEGNAHVRPSDARYDRVLTPSPGFSGGTGPMTAPAYGSGSSARWELLDGPDAPSYHPPSAWASINYSAPAGNFQAALEDADNPLRAVAKYRTIYFHYSNE